ncbi:MAG: hypothetical protein ACOCWO_05285, partial [Candidatus Muiribacteriaceae bacterium]
GYPDGSFNGKGSITRYEMAVTIAKMLDKVNDVQTSGGFIDAREAATLRKLATEFNDELAALGIRIGNLEERVQTLEDNQKKIEGDVSKFSIFGSYYYDQKFTIKREVHPYNQNEVDFSPERGFSNPFHSVNLQLLSKPSDQSEFYMKLKAGMTDKEGGLSIDSYAEEVKSTYEVNYSGGTQEISDTVKYVDGISIDDQNRLKIDSLHYKLKAPRADVRVFFREGFTSLDTPGAMLSRPWHSTIGYEFGSGVEATGNFDKDTSYFMSFFRLKDYGSTPDCDDYLSFRPRYKVPEAIFPEASLTVGGFLVQNFKKYDEADERHSFRNVRGMDFEYIKNDDYSFNATLTVLSNQSNLDSADKDDIDSKRGTMVSTSYKKGDLSSNIDYFNFEPGFYLYYSADYMYSYLDDPGLGIPYSINQWGDRNVYGENYFNISNSYNMAFGNDQSAYVKSTFMKLWWDESDTEDSWFNHEATMFTLDVYATFSSKFKLDLLNSIKKGPAQDEKGVYRNELKANATLNEANATKMDVGVWSEKDNDDRNKADDAKRNMGVYSSVSWNATDTIFMKTGFDYGKSAIGWDSVNSDGSTEYRWWKVYLENTIDLSSSTSWENSIYWKQAGTYGEPFPSKRMFKTVLSNSFTERLKGRFGYWVKEYYDDEQKQHVFADVNYQSQDGTKLQLYYSPSYNYEGQYHSFDAVDFEDDGNDHKNSPTFKQFKFTVSTDF